jgi:hypothetical protein
MPCRVDCFPLGALARISFSRARYVFAFDDVVGTLIYSTIRIVSLHSPEKRRRLDRILEKPALNLLPESDRRDTPTS